MNHLKSLKLAYFVIGIAAFCYVLIRAFSVGITYDEVWTIKGFVPLNTMNIINFSPPDANNHLLNTLLIKLFFQFGNESVVIARLPNVIAFCFYAFYGFKITSKYLSPFIGICCFLLLLLNPFLLDFFSLARGYGLSLAFVLISLYFTLEFTKKYSVSSIFGSLGFGALAVLSNFSTLNYWLSIALIINLIALFSRTQFNFKKTALYSLGISIVLLALIYEPLRKLKQNGNLYYGGDTSFYHDTLESLANYSFYHVESNSFVQGSLNVFLVLLVLSILLSFYFKRVIFTPKTILLSITLLSIASIVLQHVLFDTLYLIDRTALFFVPLFMLVLCFSINEIPRKIGSAITLMIVVGFGLNFMKNANLTKAATWYFEAHTAEILTFANTKGKKLNRKIKLDFSWPFGCSIGYYTQTYHYPYIQLVNDPKNVEEVNKNADYYLYLSSSLNNAGYDKNTQKIRHTPKRIIKQFKNEGIILYAPIRK